MYRNYTIIPGEQFGKWKVLGDAGQDNDGNRLATVECECGTIKTVAYSKLRSGKSGQCKSCGAKEAGSKKIKDYTGVKINNLTFVRSSRKHGTRGILWFVQCDCGEVFEARSGQVVCGRVVACPKCVKALGNKVKNLYSDRTLILRYRNKAKSRGIYFDEFMVGEIVRLFHEPCYYCGAAAKSGIDRIDSSRGYIAGNIRSCCTRCNIIKMDASEEDFYNHCRAIVERMEQRCNLEA